MDFPIASSSPNQGLLALSTVWTCVGVMFAVCGLILSILLIRRHIKDRKDAVHLQRKQQMMRFLITQTDPAHAIVTPAMIHQQGGVRVLSECAAEILSQLRGDAYDAVAAIVTEPSIIEAQIRLLTHGTHHEKMTVVTLFSLLNDDTSLHHLRSMLATPDRALRFLTMEALGARADMASLPQIIDRLATGEIATTIRISYLFRQFGSEAVPSLCQVALNEGFMPMRIAALIALSHIGDARALEALLQLVKHENPNIRAQSFVALARLGDKRAESVIEAGLQDTVWTVRLQSAVLVGKLGLSQFLPMLARLLEDPEWWVRLRAAEAMRGVGEEGALLLKEIRQGSGEAASIAGLVLSEERGLVAL